MVEKFPSTNIIVNLEIQGEDLVDLNNCFQLIYMKIQLIWMALTFIVCFAEIYKVRLRLWKMCQIVILIL